MERIACNVIGTPNRMKRIGHYVKNLRIHINRVPKKIACYTTLGITYGITLGLDQSVKGIINALLPVHPGIKTSLRITPEDLPLIANIRHYTSSSTQFLELLGFAVLPFFLMYAAAKKQNLKNDRLYQLGLGLLGAGTSGNFINHLICNYTTDFLHVPFTYFYANLADIATLIGLPVFLWRAIANRSKK